MVDEFGLYINGKFIDVCKPVELSNRTLDTMILYMRRGGKHYLKGIWGKLVVWDCPELLEHKYGTEMKASWSW